MCCRVTLCCFAYINTDLFHCSELDFYQPCHSPTDNKRKVSQVFNNNSQGGQLRGQPRNRWCNFVQQILIDAKLKLKKEVKNRADWRSPLRRQRSTLDCSAIYEEEEEGEEEEEMMMMMMMVEKTTFTKGFLSKVQF